MFSEALASEEIPFFSLPDLSKRSIASIYRLIKRDCFDLVYGNSSHGCSRNALIAAKLARVPFICHVREMGWEKSEKSIRARILSAFGVHTFILAEEMAGSYAQAYVIQDRFCGRVNTFLDLLGIVMTELVGHIENDEDDLLVWWDECKARDPARDDKLHLEARKNKDISKSELRQYMGKPPAEDAGKNTSAGHRTDTPFSNHMPFLSAGTPSRSA